MTPLLYMIYNVRSYVGNSVRCHSATVYGARQFTQEHFLYRADVEAPCGPCFPIS